MAKSQRPVGMDKLSSSDNAMETLIVRIGNRMSNCPC